MAVIDYLDIENDVQLIPIRALGIYVPSGATAGDPTLYLNFYYLETESSYNADPISVVDSLGSTRVIGYNQQMIIYLSFNEFDTNQILEYLDDIKDLYKQVRLSFGNRSAAGTPTPPEIENATAGATVIAYDPYIEAAVESLELRTRLKLTLRWKTDDLLTTFL